MNATSPLASFDSLADRPSLPPTLRSPGRFDMYGPIHKGLRHAHCRVLVELGRTTFSDDEACERALAALEEVLDLGDRHVVHEETHVHPVLAQRAPTSVAELAAGHVERREIVAELRALAGATRAARPSARALAGKTLYLHFAAFFARELDHMNLEERVVQPLLERHFDDEELGRIHERLVAALEPAELMASARAMVPAMSRAERAALVAGAKANAHPAVFGLILSELRPTLSEADFADLLADLG